MARAGRPRPDVDRLRIVGLVVLGLLVVVTAVLVWIAATRVPEVPAGASADPIPEATETYAPPPASEPLVLPPLSRLIVPDGADGAWRTASLACAPGRTAQIFATDDGGESWEQYGLGEVGAAAILAVQPAGDTLTAATLSADGCELGHALTFTGGEFWRDEPGQVGVPFVLPGAPQLRVGGNRIPLPCADPAGFAAQDGAIAVLCSDAVLRVSADDGATWSEPEDGRDIIALVAWRDGWLLAQLRQDGCAGIRLSAVDVEGAEPEEIACLAAFDGSEPIALGAGARLWAWIGSRIAVSDDGREWPEDWTRPLEPEPSPSRAPA